MLLVPLLLAPAPPRVLIVGGGPSPEYNQAAIESNVRYVARVLPPGAPLRVLFADGSATRPTVRYTPVGGVESRDDLYRRPRLSRLDGPALAPAVEREIGRLARAPLPAGARPALLYFTGHGSLADDFPTDVSQFDLWHDDRIAVPELARSLAAFPKATPVVLLMVQCHAGGFAKLIFRDGDPARPPVENRFCGFFATLESRLAAGCTPSIDEADYHDFTGYFVAALTGRDRLGRPVAGADYDHDGRVGMDEAFCWAMVHDESIDTPTCTSDELLRDRVRMPDARTFATPYATVLAWASPAQRAAIGALGAGMRLAETGRLAAAYRMYAAPADEDEDLADVRGLRLLRLVKSVVLGHALRTGPDSALRRRYLALLRDEAANPFRPGEGPETR